MDNRWRFLYCRMTELRGRTEEVWAGKGKTGASAAGEGKANPPFISRGRDAERNKVAKHTEAVPRKAAMVHGAPVP